MPILGLRQNVGNQKVISSPVGLVTTNAVAVRDQSLDRSRLPITNRGKPASDHFRFTFSKPVTELLQLRVLRLSLVTDGNVRIGVFPQRQKFLVRRAALGSVAPHRVGASELRMAPKHTRGSGSAHCDALNCCYHLVAFEHPILRVDLCGKHAGDRQELFNRC